MERTRRHRLITSLLANAAIRSQEQLRAALKGSGVDVTQGTLSRDLRELGVIKGPSGYFLPGVANSHPASEAVLEELRELLSKKAVSVQSAGTVVVVKTEPGQAPALAFQLDRAPPPGVAGCIAGDDTIFLAARTQRDAQIAQRVLLKLGGFQ